MQLVGGYVVTGMSHYIVDPTRSCDPCTCTVPRMCNQRHYDQVLYVRESKLFNTPTAGYSKCSDKWRPDKWRPDK